MRIQSVKVRLHNNSGYCPALSFTSPRREVQARWFVVPKK